MSFFVAAWHPPVWAPFVWDGRTQSEVDQGGGPDKPKKDKYHEEDESFFEEFLEASVKHAKGYVVPEPVPDEVEPVLSEAAGALTATELTAELIAELTEAKGTTASRTMVRRKPVEPKTEIDDDEAMLIAAVLMLMD